VAGYRRSPLTPFGNINDNSWYIRRSSDNSFLTRQYGKAGSYEFDAPEPADYDGDGKTDLGLYALIDALGAGGSFKVWQSLDGTRYERAWGSNIDRIVPRDYDGDGKADLATVRIEPRFSNNRIAFWQILQSSDGATKQVQFGLATDITVPADYDGDRKTDIAVFRPSNGTWYLQQSKDGFAAYVFGLPDDVPVTALAR